MATRATGMSSGTFGQKSRGPDRDDAENVFIGSGAQHRRAVSLILITTVHESLKFISLYLKIVYRRRYITQGT